ncbi:MAG: magnesium transporter [Candidatus Competibacteraceae bacterium]|jgi:magnesium transporter|nr:magnesium transporter [Candidatus Competibacteraceae bacterium]
MNTPAAPDQLQDHLRHITELLDKHRLVETMVHSQDNRRQALIESLVHRQHLVKLHLKLKQLHPADIAFMLETLPPEYRALVWEQVSLSQRGEVLLQASNGVRDWLIETTDRDMLKALLGQLDADDLSDLAEQLPADLLQEVSQTLSADERNWLRSSMAYPDDSVGHLMSYEMIIIRENATLEQVVLDLRRRKTLPEQTDQLFVVDGRHVFKGVISLQALLLNEPTLRVAEVMVTEVTAFTADSKAGDAVQAFDRYDLVSAPVVDNRGKLLGRLTVDEVLDYIRERNETEALNQAGLSGEEDLFAPIWDSARNRWLWLSINLVTAFLASRVIGLFEDTITQLVALATLMPIVAGIGGNTGNQTVALVIRGLALGQIQPGNTRHLLLKELTVSLLNGLVWGGVMGVVALLLYQNLALGLVMSAAMLLNLIIAALVGILVPLGLRKLGRDPVLGSSVLLTFTTDGMGFFIFLGLATVFLL